MSNTAKLRYIPLKMKEEMLALHAEDSARWSATTLSARFSAPRENVEGLLRLARFRQREEVSGRERRSQEESEGLEKMREKAVKAWKELPELTERGGSRRGERRLAEPSVMAKGEAAKVAAKETEGGGVVAEAEHGEPEEEEELVVVEKSVRKSRTAEWVEEFCKEAERDVSRRTTFAFIEVGGKGKEGGGGMEEVERAVWIREGESGKLRVAEEMERKVLLHKVRVVDSGLWK